MENTKPAFPSSTTKLVNMHFLAEMMDAQQIYDYVSNMDALQISNKFSVGSNTLIPNFSFSVGSGNVVGAYGFRMLSKEIDNENQTTLIAVDGEIPEVVDQKKPKYSYTSVNATLDVGDVLEVDFANRTILVSGIVVGTDSSSILYFADYPLIGTVPVNQMGFAIGSGNLTVGHHSFASGYYCVAGGNYAHAEGKMCKAAWGSHAEGANNEALRECSHVEGRFNANCGIISHAKGGANIIANGCRQAEVGGYMALAESDLAYVWNGARRYGYQGDPTAPYSEVMQYSLPDTTIPSSLIEERTVEYMHSQLVLQHMYKSHGRGTYNINPENGIEGFYIGEKTLLQHIQENSSTASLSDKTYSRSQTPMATILYDIAEALGATITE